MAGELLSQAERDTLLSRTNDSQQAEVYDFRSTDTSFKRLVQSLERLHRGLAQGLGVAMSSLLRMPVEVKLIGVRRVTIEGFTSQLTAPACLYVLRGAPLESPLLVDVSPGIVFSSVDRLLGGSGVAAPLDKRSPTEIEQRVFSRVMTTLVDELRRVWRASGELQIAVERYATDARSLRLGLPDDGCVVSRFEWCFAGQRGAVSLCLGETAAEALAVSRPAKGKHGTKTPSGGGHATGEQVGHPTVELIAELARTQITAGEILNLRVGDIVMTEKGVDEPIELRADGRARFVGHPGALRGNKAIRIDRALEPPTSQSDISR